MYKFFSPRALFGSENRQAAAVGARVLIRLSRCHTHVDNRRWLAGYTRAAVIGARPLPSCTAESTPIADAAANNGTLNWFVYQISAGAGQYPGLQLADFE